MPWRFCSEQPVGDQHTDIVKLCTTSVPLCARLRLFTALPDSYQLPAVQMAAQFNLSVA